MSSRRCASKKRKVNPSESWYVGYAEDQESVEAIMKKFEQLDQFQQTVDQGDKSDQLNTTQLEEVFKLTSSFTVESAQLDDFDNPDFCPLQSKDISEDEDYEIAGDDFWDHIKRKSGSKGEDKAVLQKYRIQEVRVQDKSGNYYMVKKKILNIDSNIPSYIRVPPTPLSRAWARIIKPPRSSELSCSNFIHGNILAHDFTNFPKYQAIYMDPPFALSEHDKLSGQITMKEFSKLHIQKIIKSGFLFIWVDKSLYAKLLKVTAHWGFRYVENFAWIRKNLNNTINITKAKYFNKSHSTCLIFRKEGEYIELRHQRNPDCEFDFIKPPQGKFYVEYFDQIIIDGQLSEEKPEFVYDVIETLLPTATGGAKPKLLELWGRKGIHRSNWTTFVNE